MDKCSYYIKSVRDSMNNPVWVFDTGDFLPAIPDPERSGYIIRAMQRVGYNAACTGDQEFLAGQTFYQSHFPSRQELNPIKNPMSPTVDYKWPAARTKNILSGNLYSIETDSLLHNQRMMIVQKKGIIYITSVIDPRAFLFFPEEHRQWFTVESWEDYLENDLPARGLKVLLSHSGLMTDKEIAAEFPEIGIIIGGHSQHELHEAVIEGETIIVQAGGSGRYVGRLDLKFTDNGDDVADYLYTLVPMTPDIPSDTAILAIIEEYEHAFFKDNKPRPHIARYADSLDVLGAETCRECHAEQYDQWAGTDHAQAFGIIEVRKKIYNPGCLSCHTTGYGHKNGFVTAESTPQWKNIACTECHYMSSNHLDNPDIFPQPVTASVCTRCHTKRNSPDFNYEKYLKLVRH